MEAARDEERRALLHFLEYQRSSVLSIVEGLDEEAWHTPVVPSGWTPAGLVQHLGDAERHWFQYVVTGSEVDLPWAVQLSSVPVCSSAAELLLKPPSPTQNDE